MDLKPNNIFNPFIQNFILNGWLILYLLVVLKFLAESNFRSD